MNGRQEVTFIVGLWDGKIITITNSDVKYCIAQKLLSDKCSFMVPLEHKLSKYKYTIKQDIDRNWIRE